MNVFIATIKDRTAILTADESWHCYKVLRHKAGDEVMIIDGAGTSYKGELVTANEKQCIAQLTEGPFHQEKRNYYLHLAIAPTKQIDRIEWMIEKAVEIGVDELSFIKCKNSERVNLKIERIQKIVESAVKQSMQSFLPRVNPLDDFKHIVKHGADVKLIAHCNEGEKHELQKFQYKNCTVLALVGPEGDFTDEEVELAKSNGFKALSLGTNRLRTETAGLYITQAISILTKV
jgi:16S rRNA (uracil1498-N3)-methyltransferase